MSRTKPEWIGKTDDSMPPPMVRLRIFRDRGGRCHWSGAKIQPGDQWDLDHVRALEDDGQNRETNLAPILRAKHREKTSAENSRRAKADRIAAKHLGIHKPKSSLSHPTLVRGFDGQVRPRAQREDQTR